MTMESTMAGDRINGHGRAANSTHASPIGVSRSEVLGIPEQRLMIAVLRDAIGCCIRGAHTHDVRQRRLRNEAARWMGDGDTVWPYSFENICAALGLDAATVRRRLRAQWFGKQGNDARVLGAAGVPRRAA
jgi:hypothetical protein